MSDTKEQLAKKQIDRFANFLSLNNLTVSEPVRNKYSYQINISNKSEKISLHIFFGKKGNKIVIQGNKDLKLYREVSDLIYGERFINEEKPESEPDFPYIGTDESGKGDYFGPLVVGGVYLTKETGRFLRTIGIKDSKELSDLQIHKLAEEIKNQPEIIYDLVLISPQKYNQLYEKMGNLNRMMGWAHARVIENILDKCNATEVISDKFGNEKIILDALQHKGSLINLRQVTKAEKFIAVAAASILARDVVIGWFHVQSNKYKIEIIKGSSAEVEKKAMMIKNKFGEEVLTKLVKLHFKTSKKIFHN